MPVLFMQAQLVVQFSLLGHVQFPLHIPLIMQDPLPAVVKLPTGQETPKAYPKLITDISSIKAAIPIIFIIYPLLFICVLPVLTLQSAW